MAQQRKRRRQRVLVPWAEAALRVDQRGFTLVEVLMACVVLTVGIGSIATTALRCSGLQQTTGDYVHATDVCRDVFEKLRTNPTTQFQTYKAAPSFQSGDLQVSVTFPAALLAASLGESVPTTARFRDLNGDGQVDLNTAGTDVVSPLPVQVTVWRGDFRMTMSALVMER